MKKNNKGFTLIELLAVITIMGILMMVAIPAVTRTIENSRRDTFSTVAKSYINAVRENVLADNIDCGGTVASATANGTYYIKIDADSDATKDLMEQGGRSPWGNSNVMGYVKWVKKNSSTGGVVTEYSIKLGDSAGHGFTEEVTEKSVTRSNVSTSGATPSASDAPASASACTLNK